METSPDKIDEFAPSLQDVNKHLAKYYLDHECPDCKNPHWEIHCADKIEYVPAFFLKYPPSQNDPSQTNEKPRWNSIACFILICSQCGYIKFYSKSKVKQFTSAQNIEKETTKDD